MCQTIVNAGRLAGNSFRLMGISLICVVGIILAALVPSALADELFAVQGLYSVHVGSFRQTANAEGLVDTLRQAGHDAFALPVVEAEQGGWTRVYVGKFVARLQAAQALERLRQLQLSEYYAVRHIAGGIALLTEPGRAPALEKTIFYGSDNTLILKEVPVADLRHTMAEAGAMAETEEAAAEPFATAEPELTPPATATPAEDGSELEERLSLALQAGIFYAPEVGGFRVNGSGMESSQALVGVTPKFRLSKYIGLYGQLAKQVGGGGDLSLAALGTELHLPSWQSFSPYLKAGALYADLEWDRAPGKFSGDSGWETGAGISYAYSSFRFGIDYLYRDLSFDYRSDDAATASNKQADCSGHAFLGSFGMSF